MTDQTAQEPTMEEILASIRRIISEDDAPAETAQAAAPAPEPEPAYEPEPEPVEVSTAMMDETPSTQDDDVLELTDRYEEPAAETIGDLDVTPSAPEPAWAPEPEPFPAAAAPAPSSEGLIGAAAAGAAVSAFAGLTAAVRKPAEPELPAGAGTSLEALVGSLLRPMLKEWLDANLPAIVEAQVRKEVERLARQAG
jgi:cell pole-organizing protein PopZ